MTATVTHTKIVMDRKPWWLWWRFRDLRYRLEARRLGVAYDYTMRFPVKTRFGWHIIGYTSPEYAEADA